MWGAQTNATNAMQCQATNAQHTLSISQDELLKVGDWGEGMQWIWSTNGSQIHPQIPLHIEGRKGFGRGVERLKMVFWKCKNQPPTGGRKGPLNSQTPKLAVGAPTGISWAPRAHVGWDPVCTGSRVHGVPRILDTPCARGSKTPCTRGPQDSQQQPTKTSITWAYGLRIRWSWARFEAMKKPKVLT